MPLFGSHTTNDRLEERKIAHENKRLVIFDSDATIHSLNKEASKTLNEKGIFFYKSLKLLRERRRNLSFSYEGITETFKNNEVKLYLSTERTCICTFHKENLVPCYHMVYVRENLEFILFDVDTFYQRYRRDFNVEENEDVPEEEIVEDNQESVIPYDELESVSLTDKDKYKIIMPILNNIGTLVSCTPPTCF